MNRTILVIDVKGETFATTTCTHQMQVWEPINPQSHERFFRSIAGQNYCSVPHLRGREDMMFLVSPLVQ